MMLSDLREHFSRITPRRVEVKEWPAGAIWIKPVSAAQAVEFEARAKDKSEAEISVIAVYMFALDEGGQSLFANATEAEAMATIQALPVGTLNRIAQEAVTFTTPDNLGN